MSSLPLLLLAVVGGIGSAAGALLAGILLGGMPLLAINYLWFRNLSSVLPGTMGIALGRNPNGIVKDLRDGWSPLVRAPLALGATLAAVAGVLALRWFELISGPTWAALMFAASLVGPLMLRFGIGLSSRPEAEPEPDEVAWEWVGIDRPFDPADVAALDRAVGLEGAPTR